MQIKLCLLGIIFLMAACNNDAPGEDKVVDTILSEEEAIPAPDRLLWVSDFDTVKNESYLRKQRTVNPDSLTAASLVADLNAAWENVKLVLVKTSNDTLYVSIPESEYLGQQMGSAGAQAYMASTTYNLTELKGINYVNYSMQPGDHASPGTYSRKSFENYR
jgi:hypothetical protein